MLGNVAFRGHYGLDWSDVRACLRARTAETWTNQTQGTYLTLETTQAGQSVLAERLRIDPWGNVGIGTTSPQASSTSPATSE